MTNDERSRIQQLFDTFRQETGDGKMIHIRFDSRTGRERAALFADWLSKLRGAKRGTINP